MAVFSPARLRAAIALVALTTVAVACGDSTAPTIEEVRFHPSLGIDLGASTQTASGLYYRDITVGTGATAAAGDEVVVGYALYNTNGSLWDESDETGLTFTVVGPTEQGRMLRGFNEGVTGMKVGGRRQLIIPPHLGYGNAWYGEIPPNSILVFDVQLHSVK